MVAKLKSGDTANASKLARPRCRRWSSPVRAERSLVRGGARQDASTTSVATSMKTSSPPRTTRRDGGSVSSRDPLQVKAEDSALQTRLRRGGRHGGRRHDDHRAGRTPRHVGRDAAEQRRARLHGSRRRGTRPDSRCELDEAICRMPAHRSRRRRPRAARGCRRRRVLSRSSNMREEQRQLVALRKVARDVDRAGATSLESSTPQITGLSLPPPPDRLTTASRATGPGGHRGGAPSSGARPHSVRQAWIRPRRIA